MRVRRITQDFTPVDLPFPGFGGKFRVFQRFLRVFQLRFNLLWIEWFRTRSCHRCYPCLYGHEQNIGMVTSTLRVTPFNGFSVTQSRPRGKSLACYKVRSWGKADDPRQARKRRGYKRIRCTSARFTSAMGVPVHDEGRARFAHPARP